MWRNDQRAQLTEQTNIESSRTINSLQRNRSMNVPISVELSQHR